MKVFFINDSTSNPNWGDRAAAISLKHMISNSGGSIIYTLTENELGTSSFVNISKDNNYIAIKNKPNRYKDLLKLFIPPIASKIKNNIERKWHETSIDDIIPKSFQTFETTAKHFLKDKSSYSDILDAISACDVVIIHGNGCMTGFNRVARAELFLSYLAKYFFKKPVLILNHTADFNDPKLFDIARHIYPLFDDIVFREFVSIELTKSICIGRHAPDSAFIFKPNLHTDLLSISRQSRYFEVWPDKTEIDLAKPYICLGGSAIFHYNQIFNPIQAYIKLIQSIRTIYEGQILLTVSDYRDQEMFRQLAILEELPLLALTIPLQQAIDILGNAQAYIGGRWHPSIFSLRGGTPIIPISSNTFKMSALAEMAGLPVSEFNALELDSRCRDISNQLQFYLDRLSEFKTKLSDWAEIQAERSWSNVDYLSKLNKI